MEANNKSMREALVNASMVLAKWRLDAPVSAWNEYCETIDRCRAAIAKPPRNCEVGTPDEQSERFDAYCRKHMGCKACPLRDADGSVPKHCEFRWAQMPYEEGGAK